jgi:hypothetical protein
MPLGMGISLCLLPVFRREEKRSHCSARLLCAQTRFLCTCENQMCGRKLGHDKGRGKVQERAIDCAVGGNIRAGKRDNVVTDLRFCSNVTLPLFVTIPFRLREEEDKKRIGEMVLHAVCCTSTSLPTSSALLLSKIVPTFIVPLGAQLKTRAKGIEEAGTKTS